MSVTEQAIKALFRYRFGSAEFDEASCELSVAGMTVDIEPKPLEVLAQLLTHAGEVVTKEELLTNVWAGRPIVETVITNALTKLRFVLGEDNAKCIVTHPRVGYRIVGPVERVSVGRVITSCVKLQAGDTVPLRPHFRLESLISTSNSSEVWIARHLKTQEQRVYKFAIDGERLSTLKREVTLFRLLRQCLGVRNDLIQILDWNFETPPFFIECEYGGESLQTWAERPSTLKSFTLQERIDLFLKIADVVAAAHDVGVLHKDLKPANVLIAPESDATWRIRLTDFGSGRVLDPQRLIDLGITQLGLTMTATLGSSDNTGTLLYLAPELMTHQTPTIQSDVYALGMMLYQLIIGDLRKPLVSGWERDIEDELMRDDIRAATEGNPEHRLKSVHELIHRLRTLEARHQRLQQERQSQIVADQARETLRRAQARRPWMIAAIALLTIGLATSTWLHVRTLHAQAQAEQQAARANAVTDFLDNDVLGAADPFSAEGMKSRTVQETMTRAADNIDGKFSHDPMTEAAIRMTLGIIFDSMLDNAAAEIQWRRAVALLTNAGAAVRPQLLQSHYALALSLSLESKFEQAAAELADTDHLQSQYGVNDPQTLLMAHRSWGAYFSGQMQNAQAIPHFEQALQLLLRQPSPNSLEINRRRLALADSYISVNRLKEAEQLSLLVLDDLKGQHDPSSLSVANAEMLYGQSLLYQHRFQAAEPVLDESYQITRAALGINNRHTLNTLTSLCVLYDMTHRHEKNLQCTRPAYDISRAILGEHHAETLIALSNVGMAQYAMNRYADAAHSLESARTGLARIVSNDNYAIQGADYYLARCLLQLHQIDRAKSLVEPLDAKILEGGEPGAPWSLRLQLLRGMVLLNQGKRSEALSLLLPANQLHDDADPTDTILQEARQSLRKTGSVNSEQHLAVVLTEPRREEAK